MGLTIFLMISSDRIKLNKRDKNKNFPPFLQSYLLLQLAVFLELCALSENCLVLGTDNVRG